MINPDHPLHFWVPPELRSIHDLERCTGLLVADVMCLVIGLGLAYGSLTLVQIGLSP